LKHANKDDDQDNDKEQVDQSAPYRHHEPAQEPQEDKNYDEPATKKRAYTELGERLLEQKRTRHCQADTTCWALKPSTSRC
jgi:hypothetical protein